MPTSPIFTFYCRLHSKIIITPVKFNFSEYNNELYCARHYCVVVMHCDFDKIVYQFLFNIEFLNILNIKKTKK